MVLPLGHKRDRQELKAFEKLHPPGLSPKWEGGGGTCRTSSGVPPPTRTQDPSRCPPQQPTGTRGRCCPTLRGREGNAISLWNGGLCLAPTPYTYTLKRNCEDDKVMRIFSKNRGPWGAPMLPCSALLPPGQELWVWSHPFISPPVHQQRHESTHKREVQFLLLLAPPFHLLFWVSSCSPTAWAFTLYLHSTSSLFWSMWTDPWTRSQKGRAPSTPSSAKALGNPGLCLLSTQAMLASDILASSAVFPFIGDWWVSIRQPLRSKEHNLISPFHLKQIISAPSHLKINP